MKNNIDETNEMKGEMDLTVNQRRNGKLNISPTSIKTNQENFFEKVLIKKENVIHYSDDSSYKRCFKCFLVYYKNGIHKCDFEKIDDSFQYSVDNNITLSLNLKKENFKLKKQEISKSIIRYNMRIIFKKNISN